MILLARMPKHSSMSFRILFPTGPLVAGLINELTETA
jgi:hypothetical protein